MTPSPSPRRTLLAIFAHPDDEAFGSGGALTLAAANGAAVHLVCATRGESGRITDPAIDPDADVGRLREGELRDACRELGIEPPILLDFHDSGRKERTRHDDPKALMNVDETELETAILAAIGRLEPDALLTFDPHGIYGHIDHLKVHRAATAAFWSAGSVTDRPPRRLYYVAMRAATMKALQAARPESALADLDAERYGVGDDAIALEVDVRGVADVKERAIRAHRSQVGPASNFRLQAEDGSRPPAWESVFASETFTVGGTRGAVPEFPLADFFDGL